MEMEVGVCGDGSSVTAAKRRFIGDIPPQEVCRHTAKWRGTVPLSPFYSIAPKLYYMKILLLGKNGQVGWELQRTLTPLGKVTALGRQDLDLTQPAAIRSAVRSSRPELIVNAAAYTAVDRAEEEPDLAKAVNGTAPGILAEEALLCKAGLIHYSTDYVFSGTKTTPYTEEDIPNPINVYGKTKLAGEKAIQATGVPHIIFRTSWVYSLRGHNFLLTILRLAAENDELTIVDDQFGSPTWARMIAEATAQVIAQGSKDIYKKISVHGGIYHLAAAGQTSWHGFTEAVLKISSPTGGKSLNLKAISSAEYKTPAARPDYSVLDCSALEGRFSLKLPEWYDSLALILQH